MLKQKKPLTAKQQQNRYKMLQYGSYGGMFISIITPFITMAIVNYKDWFVYSEEGWKIGLGGGLGLALMGIAVFLVTKNKEKEVKNTDGFIALIVGWFAAAFIFYLLSAILNEIFVIMLFGGIGLCGAFGFNIFANHEKKKAEQIKIAREKVKQEKIEDAVRKEQDKVEF